MERCSKCRSPLSGVLGTIGKIFLNIKPSADNSSLCNKCSAKEDEKTYEYCNGNSNRGRLGGCKNASKNPAEYNRRQTESRRSPQKGRPDTAEHESALCRPAIPEGESVRKYPQSNAHDYSRHDASNEKLHYGFTCERPV